MHVRIDGEKYNCLRSAEQGKIKGEKDAETPSLQVPFSYFNVPV